MTDLFAVFRVGVYRHGCCGIFSTKDAAIDCAEAMAKADWDSWHHYEVIPFILDQQSELRGERPIYKYICTSPEIVEADPIYECEHEEEAS